MSHAPVRQSGGLNPSVAWTVVTDSPLKGLALQREAGVVFAWDEGDLLYLLDLHGQRRATARAPGRVLDAAASDEGSLLAVLIEGPRLWLLDGSLTVLSERAAIAEASTLAVDPHGRYVAVASKLAATQLYTRHGRTAGRFETQQPLAHLAFVPSRPILIGASAYGTIVGVELAGVGGSGRLDPELLWQNALMSNVGRLATSGDGGMILVSCFTHGLQRYDLRGHNEGAYHLGGSTAQAVPDFPGRTIAVATQEGELVALSRAGTVRWKTGLPRPAAILQIDALGRYLIYGLSTGEITRLDLEPWAGDSATAPAPTPSPSRTAAAGGHRSGAVRTPDWVRPVAQTDEQAETAVVAVLDEPTRIAVVTSRLNRLQVFGPDGQPLGEGPEAPGVGRFLRTAPGWIAAATDRQVVLYDARHNSFTRLDVSLVELTHLIPRPDTFGLALVQEGDRLGRVTPSGRWIWKVELNRSVEELALGPRGTLAATTADGQLRIFDPSGERAGGFQADPPEPLLLIEAPEGTNDDVAWVTLARRAQVLRGHQLDGQALWESPVPWEAWQLLRVGVSALAVAPDGRAIAYDDHGHAREQSRSGAPNAVYFAGPRATILRVVRQGGVHLICSNLASQVAWRAIAEAPLGPLDAGWSGTAALIGRNLAWFSNRSEG